MCSWPRLLCCCSHHEGFPSPAAGRAGGTETKSKISWLFSEEEAAKNHKNKTGLETLGYKPRGQFEVQPQATS